MRVSVAIAVACLGLVGLSVADESQASIRKQTNIPAQGLGPALQSLAKEREFQIVYVSEEISDRRTQGATGELTIGEALTRLLNGTGLTYRYLDENTVTVLPLSTESGAESPSSAFDSAAHALSTPQAFNNLETADPGTEKRPGFWDRFRLAQNDQSSKKSDLNKQAESPSQSSDKNSESRVIDEVVVTGTHIRGVAPSSSHLTIYDREDIRLTGAATIQEFTRLLPENLATINGDFSNGGVGFLTGFDQAPANSNAGSGINLRGLGPGSTLVLVNGNRIAPVGAGGSFTDISMIPLSAVERIEVLADGASAVYGADAVAGVVNIITRRDFSGAETALRYGGATRGGAEEFVGSQLLGGSWERGSALLVYEHGEQEPLMSDERDFIPDLSGGAGIPVTISAEQRRNQVMLTGRQGLFVGSELSGTVYYAERANFTRSAQVSAGAPLVTNNHGSTELYGGSMNLSSDLGDAWRVGVGVDHSRTRGTAFLDRSTGTDFSSDRKIAYSSVGVLVDGTLFSLAGGPIGLAVGGDVRREDHELRSTSADQDLDRRVTSAFAELFIPIVSANNEMAWVKRLEMSIAGRYDRYEDRFGDSTNPKLGLLWSPTAGLALRTSYGTSFRPPLLTQLEQSPFYLLFPLPDSSATDGQTVTVLDFSSGREDLRPEESESLTVGIDFTPPRAPFISLAATYFNIRYSGRIGFPPPAVPTLDFLFESPNVEILDDFITRNPPQEFIQSISDSGALVNPFGLPLASVEAYFDYRLTNIAVHENSGVDLSIRYTGESTAGTLSAYIGGTYLLEDSYKTHSQAPSLDLLDRLGQPVDMRLRGGASLVRRGMTLGLNINYADDYENPLFSPASRISSWTTADFTARYEWQSGTESLLDGLSVDLIIQNITDEKPPFVNLPPIGTVAPNYDVANATALGRFVSLHATKRW